MRGGGRLFGWMEIASVEVLRKSDGVSEGFLIEVQRSIVKHHLGGAVLVEDTGPELSDGRPVSQSLFPPDWFLI